MASSVVSDNFETSTGAIPTLGGDSVETRLCSAWVNFNGTGVVAIRASYNVSSITDNGTGDYTVNFTTAMSDVNYSVTGLSQYDQTNTAAGAAVFLAISRFSSALSTGSVRVINNIGNTSLLYDGTTISVAVFR